MHSKHNKIELDAQKSTVSCTPMALSYISLADLIDYSCTCWQNMDEVAFHLNLQKPINLKWYEFWTSFEFVMAKTSLFLFDIVAIATNGKPLLKWSSSSFPQFCSLSGLPTVTVVLPRPSSKVDLLNDDTYLCDSVTIMMSSFGQRERGAH